MHKVVKFILLTVMFVLGATMIIGMYCECTRFPFFFSKLVHHGYFYNNFEVYRLRKTCKFFKLRALLLCCNNLFQGPKLIARCFLHLVSSKTNQPHSQILCHGVHSGNDIPYVPYKAVPCGEVDMGTQWKNEPNITFLHRYVSP